MAGLEALETLTPHLADKDGYIHPYQFQLLEIVKNELKMVEIIKKIEKEMGVDLITLIKFFKKEMVFKEKDGSEHHVYPLDYDGVYSLIRNEDGWALRYGNKNYYLKDFNKTFRFSTKTGIGRYWAKKEE